MKVLKAVIAKEFSGYFKTYTAYIVLAIYLLLSFAITFYAAYFFEFNNRNLVSFFVYQPIVLNVLLPALTMKMWAEERRQGTLEFLLTQPVSYQKLVIGKFLAALLFGIILLGMTVPFIIYSAHLFSLDYLNILSGFIGLLLVTSLLSAFGCLVSALNNNVIIAYLSTVFLGWILIGTNFNFLLQPIKEIFPLLSSRLNGILNFETHYQWLIQGQCSVSTIIYFCSQIGIALWLNILIIEWRKD